MVRLALVGPNAGAERSSAKFFESGNVLEIDGGSVDLNQFRFTEFPQKTTDGLAGDSEQIADLFVGERQEESGAVCKREPLPSACQIEKQIDQSALWALRDCDADQLLLRGAEVLA